MIPAVDIIYVLRQSIHWFICRSGMSMQMVWSHFDRPGEERVILC